MYGVYQHQVLPYSGWVKGGSFHKFGRCDSGRLYAGDDGTYIWGHTASSARAAPFRMIFLYIVLGFSFVFCTLS